MKYGLALCGLATLLASHLAWADSKPVTTTTTLSTHSETTLSEKGKTTTSSVTAKTSTAKASVEQTVQEDDNLKELCDTYADEDNVASTERESYIKKCLTQMTNLSEGMRENLPLQTTSNDEPTAAPSSRKVNDDPEALIKSELVDAPTPGAEQLDSAPKAN